MKLYTLFAMGAGFNLCIFATSIFPPRVLTINHEAAIASMISFITCLCMMLASKASKESKKQGEIE